MRRKGKCEGWGKDVENEEMLREREGEEKKT
jgi:hypothetical protein